MPSAAKRTANFLREHYSSEGFEVTGVNETDNQVWASAPPSTQNLTDALLDIYDSTGATCDLELTNAGAVYTFWCDPTWQPAPTKSSTRWQYYMGLVLVAVAVALPATYAHFNNATIASNSSSYTQEDGGAGWGW